VVGDTRRLLQMFASLIENARAQASSQVIVRVSTSGNSVVIVVEDDGPGVLPELQGRLFERFAKSPSSRGSKLGLAISRWVARAHAGDLVFVAGFRFEGTDRARTLGPGGRSNGVREQHTCDRSIRTIRCADTRRVPIKRTTCTGRHHGEKYVSSHINDLRLSNSGICRRLKQIAKSSFECCF